MSELSEDLCGRLAVVGAGQLVWSRGAPLCDRSVATRGCIATAYSGMAAVLDGTAGALGDVVRLGEERAELLSDGQHGASLAG